MLYLMSYMPTDSGAGSTRGASPVLGRLAAASIALLVLLNGCTTVVVINSERSIHYEKNAHQP